MAAYLRIRDVGYWQRGGVVVGHARIAGVVEAEMPLSTLGVSDAESRLRLERKYTLTILTEEQWEGGEVEFPPGSLVCYTDGSCLTAENTSGAGVYLESGGVRESIPLGSYATVFQAEAYAILFVATRQDIKGSPEQRIYICSDSQTALKA